MISSPLITYDAIICVLLAGFCYSWASPSNHACQAAMGEYSYKPALIQGVGRGTQHVSSSILSPLSYAAGLVLTFPLPCVTQSADHRIKNLPDSFQLYVTFLLETDFMYIMPLDSHTT